MEQLSKYTVHFDFHTYILSFSHIFIVEVDNDIYDH